MNSERVKVPSLKVLRQRARAKNLKIRSKMDRDELERAIRDPDAFERERFEKGLVTIRELRQRLKKYNIRTSKLTKTELLLALKDPTAFERSKEEEKHERKEEKRKRKEEKERRREETSSNQKVRLYDCVHGRRRHVCATCRKHSFCDHGKWREACKFCVGFRPNLIRGAFEIPNETEEERVRRIVTYLHEIFSSTLREEDRRKTYGRVKEFLEKYEKKFCRQEV